MGVIVDTKGLRSDTGTIDDIGLASFTRLGPSKANKAFPKSASVASSLKVD